LFEKGNIIDAFWQTFRFSLSSGVEQIRRSQGGCWKGEYGIRCPNSKQLKAQEPWTTWQPTNIPDIFKVSIEEDLLFRTL
jgi:hypothetical protein